VVFSRGKGSLPLFFFPTSTIFRLKPFALSLNRVPAAVLLRFYCFPAAVLLLPAGSGSGVVVCLWDWVTASLGLRSAVCDWGSGASSATGASSVLLAGKW
jgi:hypothetical protein